jgi:serine/threonine protein kinase
MKSSTYGGGSRVAWKPPEIEQLTAAFQQLEILQLLGVGGMGAVFKVRQKELDRIAALKVLPGEMAADSGFTERFLREARLLASLSHPHIVTVYEFGQRDGIYFLLMEFIDGVTLRQALRAEPIKKLGSKETLAIVGQLCDALQFAHDEGVVHRDIKPENILIDKRGRVKIADFGLARLLGQSPTMPTLTGTHQLMGTPAYMAPEQIEGLPGIDHRADIYSMGVVFYELLTGELPLGRFSPPSERAETDVRLDEVVLRTLAREPERRYQQASQVKTDVEALRSPPVSSSLATNAPRKKRRVGFFVSAFALGALMTPFLFAAMWMVMDWRWAESNAAQSERNLAEREAASRAKALAAEEQRRLAAQRSTDDEPAMPDRDGGAMSRTGDEGIMSIGGMPGGIAMDRWRMPTNAHSAIIFENSVPFLNAQLFNLTDEQRAAVNLILKETHERYLKEEALHSIVSVDANGVQTTEIIAFFDQLRAIENDLWIKLDDAVPVETQKDFRSQMNLYAIEGQSDGSGAASMGSTAMGSSMPEGGMGMSGGMMAGPGTGPGLLGWEKEHYPLMVKVSRSGRWFEWTIDTSASNVDPTEKAPTLPSDLARFYREPGPWMAVENARSAFETKNWMEVADAFTRTGRFRWYLNTEARSSGSTTRNRTEFGKEIDRLNEFFERTRPPIEKNEEILRQLREIKKLVHSIPAGAVDGVCGQGADSFSEDLGKAWFLLCVIDAATGQTVEFEPAAYRLTAVQIEESNGATGQLVSPEGTKSVPITFRFLDNQWKIESIGSNEELQLHLRNSEYAEIKAVVKNARATYAAKEWMKLADYFTNAGQARELLQFYALQSRVDIALDEVAKRSDNYLTQELAKLPEIAATIHHEWNALNPSTQFEALSLQFRNIDPVGVDTRMVEAAQSFPSESLRKGFAIWGLMSSVFSESSALEPTSRTNIDIGLEFELASGEVSSYTESGDTASATLTIPDKPPVPIRFKRENDQWKIDAIGSNERLLERLRQTKAWKHVESVTSESSTPSSPPQEPSPLPVEEPTPLAEPIPVGGATGVQ